MKSMNVEPNAEGSRSDSNSADDLLFQPTSRLLRWFPDLQPDIWILSVGQLMLFIGQGFTLVYASIYFVNQLGFSTTQVGLALSSAGISGTMGRFWAGNAVDGPILGLQLGRRGTLLVASALSALACFCLAFAATFPVLVMGNLLLGLGISFYWPATLALITDLTPPEHRTEAFALTRLADNLGLGLGAFLAGQYIALAGDYRLLFISKGVAYLLFGGVIYRAIAETRVPQAVSHSLLSTWKEALGDRTLVIYLLANVFFTTYAAQLSSTLPLYLSNFVPGGNTATGFTERFISYFFVWHALIKIVLQLPITRTIKQANHVTALLVALALWTGGFFLIWLTGGVPVYAVIPAGAAFALVALAEIFYAPAATALVGDIAPVDRRGVYFALESECWAIGFLLGPALGGWALDHPDVMGRSFWLLAIASAGIAGALLLVLRQRTLRMPAIEESFAIEESWF